MSLEELVNGLLRPCQQSLELVEEVRVASSSLTTPVESTQTGFACVLLCNQCQQIALGPERCGSRFPVPDRKQRVHLDSQPPHSESVPARHQELLDRGADLAHAHLSWLDSSCNVERVGGGRFDDFRNRRHATPASDEQLRPAKKRRHEEDRTTMLG